ncbi:MAG: response regulator transcription factor [Anaerolineales bacterium]|nr:response regulator transcription factor [Anaerolineales bacterium]
MTISIILADDHVIVRQGLRAVLSSEAALEIIGEAGDGDETLHLVETLQPDILVLDIDMPGINGLEVARQIKLLNLRTRIVFLSMYANEGFVLEALRHGASAYVLKGSETRDLVQAIHQAVKGQRYLSPPLSENAIETYLEKLHTEKLDPYETLTNREREIFLLAAQGISNLDIAEQLYISDRTVEAHKARLMKKLNLHSQAELIHYAFHKGLLTPEK